MTQTGAAAVAAALCAATAARADEAQAPRLSYDTSAAGEPCPDTVALRELVAGRLGSDPFATAEGPTLTAEVRLDGEVLVGTVQLRDSRGDLSRDEALRVEPGQCAELTEALALVVALALRQPTVSAPEPPAPAASAVVEETVMRAHDDERPPILTHGAGDPDETRPTPPTRRGLRFGILAAPSVAFGRLPDPALGGSLGLRLRADPAVVALEASLHVPVSAHTLAESRVETTHAALTLLPCFGAGVAELCGVASIGVIEARMQSEAEGVARAVVGNGGVRAMVRWRAADELALGLWCQADVALIQPSIRIDGSRSWTAPTLASTVGIAVVVLP